MTEIPEVSRCRNCGDEIERWSGSDHSWMHRTTRNRRCLSSFILATPLPREEFEPEGDDGETVQTVSIPLYQGNLLVTSIRSEDRDDHGSMTRAAWNRGWRISVSTSQGLDVWWSQPTFYGGSTHGGGGLDLHLDELGTIRPGDVLSITIERKQS